MQGSMQGILRTMKRLSNSYDASVAMKRFRPAEDVSLGEFLQMMHETGCPSVLVKLVYYLSLANPIGPDDLVDTLEIFAGQKVFSQACLIPMESCCLQSHIPRLCIHACMCVNFPGGECKGYRDCIDTHYTI